MFDHRTMCVLSPSYTHNILYDLPTKIPLILAYSMSIHKSQGQTLERVKVDLGRVFETGQAYVALSRCTSLEGLQVLNYRRDKVRVDPRVIKFNQRLGRVV